MFRKNRIYTLFTLLFLAMFVFVPAAYAYDGRSAENVSISKDETINDDLYLAGSNVVVDGTVNGDLYAAGKNVTINGKVTGSVFTAGQSVIVNGEVGKSVFAAGQVVVLGSNAQVTDDAFTAGQGVETKAGSKIGGTLTFFGAEGLVASEIAKDLVVGAGSLRLEGTVGRDAQLSVGSSNNTYNPNYYGPTSISLPSIPAGLTFGSEAHVARTLQYVSSAEIAISSSVASQVKHVLPPQDQQLAKEITQRQATSSAAFDAIRRLVSLLLMGLLFAWAAASWITVPAETLKARLLPSLGVGLVGLVASPFVFFIALGVIIVVAVVFGLLSLGSLTGLTLGAGFPLLALAFIAFLTVVSYLCQAIVAYIFGQWVLDRTHTAVNSKVIVPTLVGLLILGILFAVPVAGGVLQFLVVLAGLGALVLVALQGKPAAAPVESTPVIPA